jgi:hypothetical protein
MSSGQLKPHRGFNSVQIRDGYVVRLNKNGTVRATLGIRTIWKEGKIMANPDWFQSYDGMPAY